MNLPPYPAAFVPLNSAEQSVYGAFAAAADGSNRRLTAIVSTTDRSVTGSFLRWLLLEAIPALDLPIPIAEFRGAVVVDWLDLTGAHLTVIPRFVNCQFVRGIVLNDATASGFEMITGTASEILADRVEIKGSLILGNGSNSDDGSDSFRSFGKFNVQRQIRLCGATVGGNLDLGGCILEGESSSSQNLPALNADGIEVRGHALLNAGFSARGEVRLDGALIQRDLDFSGATLSNAAGHSLSAAGTTVNGSMFLRSNSAQERFTSQGRVRLDGANIKGYLDCSGGEFKAKCFTGAMYQRSSDLVPDDDVKALTADGLELGDDLYLGDGFHAYGEVRLIGGRIGGDLYCDGGSFDFPGQDALSADGLTVSGTVFFTGGVRTNGILRFIQARLVQGFQAINAVFDVSPVAQIRAESTSSSADELGGPSCGIYAPFVEVTGGFYWQKVRKEGDAGKSKANFWLYLLGSKVDFVDDDRESWVALDQFNVNDCEYANISNLSLEDRWRVDVLDRQYASLNPTPPTDLGVAIGKRMSFLAKNLCLSWAFLIRSLRWLPLPDKSWKRYSDASQKFSPQPYLALAKAFRDAGYGATADGILVRLEQNTTRYGNLPAHQQVWRWALNATLRYGFSPFRPVLMLLVWSLISAGVFEAAFDRHQIIPTKDNLDSYSPANLTAGGSGVCGESKQSDSAKADGIVSPPRVAFNPLLYAFDTLVPLVDLNQKKNWVVQPMNANDLRHDCAIPSNFFYSVGRTVMDYPDSAAAILAVFNAFFGWFLTTLFAAGVSGLLRRNGGDS